MAVALDSSVRWPAPAKLNLFLHVTGRRPDGYHTLQTAFQFLDLCDYLGFERRDDGVVERVTDLPGVAAAEDLVVRAARALQSHARAAAGVSISLDKRLPVSGGIGGGSSDAATTLVALNHLWALNLPVETLAQIGLGLGADVPVFVHGQAAFAEGVGEVLTPVEPAESWYVLIKPACHVATRAVFQQPDLTRHTPPITIRAFLAGAGRNDCEPVVRRMFPEVDAALAWLGARAQARLTGTGACVYAAFASERESRSVAAEVPPPWQAWVTRGQNRSPLIERLERARDGLRMATQLAAEE